jgi:OCT family organic cation transporter-like MFS transporter 4/5
VGVGSGAYKQYRKKNWKKKRYRTIVNLLLAENVWVEVNFITISFYQNLLIPQWQLVCTEGWVSGIIISIQMAGLLVSGYLSGQLSDMFGRRLILSLSFLLNGVINIAASFSTSWQMFAGLRFLIGLSSGLYLAIYIAYIIEFVPRGYRPMVQAIPSWPLAAALYGLVAWKIPNWRHIQILIGVSSLPFAICIWL